MKIAVLPGDGIGVEVTRQAVKVLHAAAGKRAPLELQEWLNEPLTEAMFEAYRAAYRSVTGTDLGAAPPGTPMVIEQAA